MLYTKKDRIIAVFALAIGLFFTVFTSAAVSFTKECEPLRERFLRLHILANSDSEEDQRLKLAVRDHILSLGLFEEAADKLQAEVEANERLHMIEEAANEALRAEGSVHTAKAELVRMYFTTRVYENVTLPAGYYDAVRITIGEGGGKTWWCVLYPPLCIPAAEAEPIPP